MGSFLIITLTIASSGSLILLSLSLTLLCTTRFIVISALRPSSVNSWSLFFLKCSILLSCTSFVSSWSVCISSQCLWSSFCHSRLVPVKHFIWWSAVAFVVYFLNTLLSIFAVYFAAVSPRTLIFSGTHMVIFSLSDFVWCATILAVVSMFFWVMSRSSSAPSFFSIFFSEFHGLFFSYRFPSSPLFSIFF